MQRRRTKKGSHPTKITRRTSKEKRKRTARSRNWSLGTWTEHNDSSATAGPSHAKEKERKVQKEQIKVVEEWRSANKHAFRYCFSKEPTCGLEFFINEYYLHFYFQSILLVDYLIKFSFDFKSLFTEWAINP